MPDVNMMIPRVTMRHVARAANVHQTTVSLALRNDASLPKKTRERIRSIADRLGYKPDPLLGALNYYRTSRHASKTAPTMALLLDHEDGDYFQESCATFSHRLFREGVREQSRQLGYDFEVFYLGANAEASGPRIERVLKARGITGVIIGAFDYTSPGFQLNWMDFCVVSIESLHLNLSCHRVLSHHMMITRDAVRHIYGLGYRRIGLAVGEHEETYLQNAFTAGYYVEMDQHPDLVKCPPLLLPNGSTAQEITPSILRWANANKIEVIISNWPSIPDAIEYAGPRMNQVVRSASLDLNPDFGPNAGVLQNHRIVGERVTEQLAILMRMNLRGLIESPNNIMIEGKWVTGSDLPLCDTRQKKRRRELNSARNQRRGQD